MSADASASSYVPAQAPAQEPTVAPEPAAEAPAAVYWHGNPAALGLPCFIAGSVALGLAFVGVVPLTALGAAMPIILTATSIGLFLATIWAAAVGQTAVASVFGIFGGFWLSYAVLSLGLNHGWFGIPLTVDAGHAGTVPGLLAGRDAHAHAGHAAAADGIHGGVPPRGRGAGAAVRRVQRDTDLHGPAAGRRMGDPGVRGRGRLPVLRRRVAGHRRRIAPARASPCSH